MRKKIKNRKRAGRSTSSRQMKLSLFQAKKKAASLQVDNLCPRCGSAGFTHACRYICPACGYTPACGE